jgi:Mitochondrial biogenesis AIM24
MKTGLFGGEGLFFASVTGPGNVWIQSLPMNRLSRAILGAITKGKGSMLGKLYVGFIILFVLITLITGV